MRSCWVALIVTGVTFVSASAVAGPEEAVPEDAGALAEWLNALEVSAASAGQGKVLRRAVAALQGVIDRASPEAAGPLPRSAHRCAAGLVLARTTALAAAQRQLASCEHSGVPEALRERGASALAGIERALRRGALSPFDLSAAQPGWVAAVGDAPEAWFALPQTVWLAKGEHKLRAAPSAAALAAGGADVVERTLRAEPHKRGSDYIAAPATPSAPKSVTLDLDDDTVLDAPTTGPPPPSKHVSLLPGKYQRGLRAERGADLEQRECGALSLYASAGASQNATAARLAMHVRAHVAPRLALELGFDWHYRFADEMAEGAGGVGALVGARVTLWAPHRFSALLAARGRLAPGAAERDASMTGGAIVALEARPVRSWPLVAGAQLELERSWRAASALLGFELWRR